MPRKHKSPVYKPRLEVGISGTIRGATGCTSVISNLSIGSILYADQI